MHQRRLTARVTRWWAGRDNAILPEPTPSDEKLRENAQTPTSRVHALLAGVDFHYPDLLDKTRGRYYF